jgi:hypothetical protein
MPPSLSTLWDRLLRGDATRVSHRGVPSRTAKAWQMFLKKNGLKEGAPNSLRPSLHQRLP